MDDRQLGEFLRSRRGRLRPEDVGLPASGRHRRVPGLRREELAGLAGVSVAYLTRLEQGKGHNVSAEVLDALARALRLTANEYEHLEHLAGARRRSAPRQERVRSALRDLLASMNGVPAYLTGRCSDILAWNPLATALFGDWDRWPAEERNLARMVFLRPESRRLFVDWESKAAEVVGALRLEAGRRPGLPALVDELSVKSEEFRRLWARHDVKERSHGTDRLDHPVAGALTLSFESFRLPDEPDQCLTVFHARPGTATAENLRLLGSWGSDTDRRWSGPEGLEYGNQGAARGAFEDRPE
ncbi:helix-turn-helix domain-containing protein [Actinomadura rugatobispora]|uniref:Helix-turn-helix domain-containing protein n=1 Tax=Actinomadura rugatobispora TaxID=1994 RepID=A0ABW1A5G2_9ACTN